MFLATFLTSARWSPHDSVLTLLFPPFFLLSIFTHLTISSSLLALVISKFISPDHRGHVYLLMDHVLWETPEFQAVVGCGGKPLAVLSLKERGSLALGLQTASYSGFPQGQPDPTSKPSLGVPLGSCLSRPRSGLDSRVRAPEARHSLGMGPGASG